MRPMKRTWLVVLAAVLAGVLVFTFTDSDTRTWVATAVGLAPAAAPGAATANKPICATAINPNVAPPTDCVPQYVADLPPDPGAAGLKTVEGIDADKDGVRDDVQRFIVINYGHSQR